MGLERKNVKISAVPQAHAIVVTFSHFMPENEPFDQSCRFTMFESSANVTRKSVSAEQM